MSNPAHDEQHSFSFASLMTAKTGLALIIAIVMFTGLFRAFPDIDLATSALFGSETGFALSHDPFLRAVRSASIDLTKGLAILLLLFWLYRLLSNGRDPLISLSKLGFSTLSLVLGPALVTNLILKENWGRPRPRELEVFGGDSTFVLPWTWSDQCSGNCSFVSGETSAAIWIITLVPFLPLAWHKGAVIAVLIYTAIISGLRIAFGGHFLSDVILSILLNGLCFWIAWGLFFRRGCGFLASDWAIEENAATGFNKARAAIAKALNPIIKAALLAYSRLIN